MSDVQILQRQLRMACMLQASDRIDASRSRDQDSPELHIRQLALDIKRPLYAYTGEGESKAEHECRKSTSIMRH